MKPLGIRSIVAATDLTDAMLPVLASANELAQLTGASLHIVHTTERAIEEADLTRHVRSAGIETRADVTTQIMVGPPGALVVQEAARVEADVIVLGPHLPGRSELGSTAYRVVRAAAAPCLILPEKLTLPLAAVLVPVDIAESPRGILAVALTWASALRQPRSAPTSLMALHVSAAAASEAEQRTRAQLEAEVSAVRESIGQAAGVSLDTAVESGALPADAVLERAQRERCDLIVMGTRGQDPQNDPLGSVSLHVVTRSATPMLLVPPTMWRHTK